MFSVSRTEYNITVHFKKPIKRLTAKAVETIGAETNKTTPEV